MICLTTVLVLPALVLGAYTVVKMCISAAEPLPNDPEGLPENKSLTKNVALDMKITKKAAKEVIKLARLAKKAKKYAKTHPIN
jgi:hypothetical protein